MASLVGAGLLRKLKPSWNMFRAVVSLVFVFGLLTAARSAPRRVERVKLDPNYLKAMVAYRKLEPKMSHKELKTITTIGILHGAMKAEKAMEKHLTELVTDLILNTDVSDKTAAMPKMVKIEETIERDKNAIQILSSAMDLATKTLTVREYKDQLQHTLEEHQSKKRETKHRKDMDLAKLKQEILDHLHHMQRKISTKIDNTLDYLQENRELDMIRLNRKRSTEAGRDLETLFTEDKLENNLVEVDHSAKDAKDANDVNITVSVGSDDVVEISTVVNETKTANQFEASEENDNDDNENGGMPGGLVGLIASLSGGEGGSDIGALVGALTGLIGQIFGPGGLDIESLISTGTSLIAGLLAGDRNFGTVLGEYVGTAFDGLSGGGGAENNGKFVGSLLGTIVASLSANPEDEDLPPQPMVFIQNLISSFKQAKNRAGTNGAEGGEEAKPQHPVMGGSDSFGFIKQIASALVGGVTSLVLNASLGASGGSSQASTSVLAGSSHHQPHPKHPSW